MSDLGGGGVMGKKVVTDDARPCSFLSSSDLDVRARVRNHKGYTISEVSAVFALQVPGALILQGEVWRCGGVEVWRWVRRCSPASVNLCARDCMSPPPVYVDQCVCCVENAELRAPFSSGAMADKRRASDDARRRRRSLVGAKIRIEPCDRDDIEGVVDTYDPISGVYTLKDQPEIKSLFLHGRSKTAFQILEDPPNEFSWNDATETPFKCAVCQAQSDLPGHTSTCCKKPVCGTCAAKFRGAQTKYFNATTLGAENLSWSVTCPMCSASGERATPATPPVTPVPTADDLVEKLDEIINAYDEEAARAQWIEDQFNEKVASVSNPYALMKSLAEEAKGKDFPETHFTQIKTSLTLARQHLDKCMEQTRKAIEEHGGGTS